MNEAKLSQLYLRDTAFQDLMQRRRSLKARNAARARWDRIRQGGAE